MKGGLRVAVRWASQAPSVRGASVMATASTVARVMSAWATSLCVAAWQSTLESAVSTVSPAPLHTHTHTHVGWNTYLYLGRVMMWVNYLLAD